MPKYSVEEYVRRFHEKRLIKPAHCEVCRKMGHLRWHGRYVRRLITWTQIYELPISRLLCTLCRHTFAFLPAFIIKFHRYAKEVIRTALRRLKTLTYEATVDFLVNRLMGGREQSLAPVTLHLWRNKFTKTSRS